MGTFKDLPGQQFGCLTVLEQAERNPQTQTHRGRYWTCICTCGKTIVVRQDRLKNGASLSCGCLSDAKAHQLRTNAMLGQRFGRLVVVGRQPNDPWRGSRWDCVCDCGNSCIVAGKYLRSTQMASCGCYASEMRRASQGKDLSGQRFGRLVVLGVSDKPRAKHTFWNCLCDCGTVVAVLGASLANGNTQSCGCYNKERISETHSINLLGQRFGRLLVVSRGTKDAHGNILWNCLCDCGVNYVVSGASLRRGATQSCGCYKRERASEVHSGANSHLWKGGLTSLADQIRKSLPYKQWCCEILRQQQYTCQYSGKVGCSLHVHHIKPFAMILIENKITTLEEALECEGLWDKANGVVLAEEYHSPASSNPLSFHKMYGTNTTAQKYFGVWFQGRLTNSQKGDFKFSV